MPLGYTFGGIGTLDEWMSTLAARTSADLLANLTSLTIGNSVASIGEYAFYFCERMRAIPYSSMYSLSSYQSMTMKMIS